MSDVWSTMAGECGRGDGLHLTTGGPRAARARRAGQRRAASRSRTAATGELVWTHLRREASPLLRYRSGDLATVWTTPCACGRTTPRIRIDGRRDDMLRVQARATSTRARSARSLDRFPASAATRSSPTATRSSRRCACTSRRPTAPAPETSRPGCTRACGRASPSSRSRPGTLPVAEHKTRIVYRTARGDELPPAIAHEEERSP